MGWDNLQERIDQIFLGQTGDGPDELVQFAPFIVIGLYFDASDLEIIRPHLRPRDSELRDLGDVGRYQRIPVFPSTPQALAVVSRMAEWRGVGFNYISMDIIN